MVFGESLGSFGGEAPFLSLNNIVARTDGGLFSGPTFNNTMWEELKRNRDPGSPQWLPIYDQGENVRFVARADNLGRPDDPWGNPRIVYLQHASDPIAWWNPDLLFKEPDWLREPRGYDVSPRMQWIPVVTFLQVSADMAVAVERSRRARAPLRPGRRQRLGGGAATARLDGRQDRETTADAARRRVSYVRSASTPPARSAR